jgi:HPt (histidine-containing phosphotransfer) domain-containing protein
MNNKKIYCRLLRNFADSALVQDVATALESGDHSAVRQAAHALKGVCANLGISALRDIAQQIELRGKEEAAAGELRPALEEAAAAAQAAIGRLLASEGA